MFEVWNYGHQRNRLADIALPGGGSVPSGKDWAGLGPGSIPYLANQPVATEGAVAHQPSYHGPADYASKVAWYLRGKDVGAPVPFGPFGIPPPTTQGPSAAGPCGPGTNDPNCTGGTVVIHPTPVKIPIGQCQAGYYRDVISGNCIPVETAGPPTGGVVETPPLQAPGGGAPATSPVTHVRAHRQRRGRVRQPYVDPNDICPLRGYVSRPISGTDEYQNFRCTPGQPVVIDPGIAAAGRADALARQQAAGQQGPALWTGQAGGWGWGTPYYNPRVRWAPWPAQQPDSDDTMAGLFDGSVDIAGFQVPTIALIAGAAALAWWMLKGKGKK